MTPKDISFSEILEWFWIWKGWKESGFAKSIHWRTHQQKESLGTSAIFSVKCWLNNWWHQKTFLFQKFWNDSGLTISGPTWIHMQKILNKDCCRFESSAHGSHYLRRDSTVLTQSKFWITLFKNIRCTSSFASKCYPWQMHLEYLPNLYTMDGGVGVTS